MLFRSLGAALVSFLPAAALAKAWHGLTPGVSTKNEVVKKFGSPTRELPLSVRYESGLVYQGKAAQERGSEEAQFFFDKEMKLLEIFVFPSVALRREDVIKAYGTGYEERRTDDFRLYFQYRTDGFIVFFDKDNESVYQLHFTPGATPPVKTATNQPPAPPDTPPPAPAPR